MNAELILGVFFIFILILFIAGVFLFPRIFGISKSDSHEADVQKSEDPPKDEVR